MKRRELLAVVTAVAALWPARRLWAAAAAGYSADRYSRAIVIDALGGPGVYHPDLPDDAPLPDVDIADAKRSGLTAINVTVNEVGNAPDRYEKTVKGISFLVCVLVSFSVVFLLFLCGF